jgi:hypothetical protein
MSRFVLVSDSGDNPRKHGIGQTTLLCYVTSTGEFGEPVEGIPSLFGRIEHRAHVYRR